MRNGKACKVMKLKIPEEVWLFAKGPSYDSTPYRVGFRVTINDMAFHVPYISMMFANDVVMQDRLRTEFPVTSMDVNTAWPLMVTRNNRLRFPFHLQHEANGHGTAGYALNVLSDLGARKFHMIGFDAYHGDYSYSKLFDSKPQEPRIYDGIIKYLVRIAEEKKLELIFYGKDG